MGVLVLAQIVGGFLVNFVLTAPLFGPPGFLLAASAHSSQIALSALCGVALGAISIVVAAALFGVAGARGRAPAIVFIALAAATLAAAVVEQVNVISMVSLSQAYTKSAPVEQASFQGLRLIVVAARNASHYLGLVVAGLAVVAFYTTLLVAALVPRVLAILGLGAAALQVVAVAMPLFGASMVFAMLAPLGVVQLVLGLWLVVKGFPQVGRAPPQ